MRKKLPFADGLANGRLRPVAAFAGQTGTGGKRRKAAVGATEASREVRTLGRKPKAARERRLVSIERLNEPRPSSSDSTLWAFL